MVRSTTSCPRASCGARLGRAHEVAVSPEPARSPQWRSLVSSRRGRFRTATAKVEIGWHLHPDSWGNGFATEAAVAVLRRGFADGLLEVWAVTDPGNHRSAAVCRRIGMQLLGITHRWYHEPSLMFWTGSRAGQEPSIGPDLPVPPGLAPLSRGARYSMPARVGRCGRHEVPQRRRVWRVLVWLEMDQRRSAPQRLQA